MASISLGGATVPNVKTCDRTDILVGKQERAHDGTLLTDYTAQKWQWRIEAVMLTEAERDALVTKVRTLSAAQTFIDLDGNSYSVYPAQGTYNEARLPINGGVRYDATFGLEQA